MDAPYYNGDIDDREFGPDPDEARCWCCGAGEDEDCATDCFCSHCLTTRPAIGLPMKKDDAA